MSTRYPVRRRLDMMSTRRRLGIRHEPSRRSVSTSMSIEWFIVFVWSVPFGRIRIFMGSFNLFKHRLLHDTNPSLGGHLRRCSQATSSASFHLALLSQEPPSLYPRSGHGLIRGMVMVRAARRKSFIRTCHKSAWCVPRYPCLEARRVCAPGAPGGSGSAVAQSVCPHARTHGNTSTYTHIHASQGYV